jgi:hypothetical protein
VTPFGGGDGGLDCFDFFDCGLSPEDPYLFVPEIEGFVPAPVELPPEPDPADVCDGMQDEPAVHARLVPNLTSLTSNDPFPGDEPSASDLGTCDSPDPVRSQYDGALDVAFGQVPYQNYACWARSPTAATTSTTS